MGHYPECHHRRMRRGLWADDARLLDLSGVDDVVRGAHPVPRVGRAGCPRDRGRVVATRLDRGCGRAFRRRIVVHASARRGQPRHPSGCRAVHPAHGRPRTGARVGRGAGRARAALPACLPRPRGVPVGERGCRLAARAVRRDAVGDRHSHLGPAAVRVPQYRQRRRGPHRSVSPPANSRHLPSATRSPWSTTSTGPPPVPPGTVRRPPGRTR